MFVSILWFPHVCDNHDNLLLLLTYLTTVHHFDPDYGVYCSDENIGAFMQNRYFPKERLIEAWHTFFCSPTAD